MDGHQGGHGLAVGVDLGGTKLAAALVAGDGSILAHARDTTPVKKPAAIVEIIAKLVTDLCKAHGMWDVPVGIGAAGIVDLEGVVRYAPNVAIADFPLAATLRELLGVPVTVDNDANVAAWAEYELGAARAATNMVMLTIGTGVGGGLVLDGQLLRGAHGLGAELGHIVVHEGGRACPCGNLGCLEAYASGGAIGRSAQEAAAEARLPSDSPLKRLPIDELTGKAVTVAAHGGDPWAQAIIEEAGFWLGVGIASLVNTLDPEVVVLGGGAMQAGELLATPARAALAERVMGRAHRPETPVVRAQLSDDAGVVGAALLALAARPAG